MPEIPQDIAEKQEYLLCAAIWVQDDGVFVHQPVNIKTGYVICGRRHHNCFGILSILRSGLTQWVHQTIQGFITSDDRFVDRKEAMQIAKLSGQVTDKQSFKELHSEDLY